MAQIKLNIPDNIYENLKQKATEEDRSVSNYINRILKLHTNTVETNNKTQTQTRVSNMSNMSNIEEELLNDPYYDPNF